ncbi:hypothetical protein D8674_012499 [Pyrus ussuriensis x Pyrus communis]|uniref:Uncharacterized protein n=1 Tax=Pyrus ussuriensis x Pyrus communis TaxID=2448454 RepID=A0A5N5G6G5_9ROSA|nr:hypothetical protein D8674_012499 [Pyrus ussuriensis x Pyrus communis]
MEKTRSLCSPTADANFVADSGIAGTAASATASTFCARKPRPYKHITNLIPHRYGTTLNTPYPVDHPMNIAPAVSPWINKETNAKLHLVRVVTAFERLWFGYFRQLQRLEVLDGGVAKIYGAVVESKSGSSDMRLVNFLGVEATVSGT